MDIILDEKCTDVNKLVLSKDLYLTNMFEGLYRICSTNTTQPELILKTYQSHDHAKTEFERLTALKHIHEVPDVYATSSERSKLHYNIISKFDAVDLIDQCNEIGLEKDDLKHIIHQVLSILAKIHEVGIVHGDIKPENILYNQTTRNVYIIDFNNEMTPMYASPERLLQGDNTFKSDIWSVGATLLLLLMTPEEAVQLTDNDMINNPLRPFKTDDLLLLDLFSGLFEKNPKWRLSADEASNHPWFNI